MTTDEICKHCLAKPKAYEDHPFGDWPICFKVNGKIFAQIYADKITLKCTAFSGQAFRDAYPGIVVRGYHCPPVQQPYNNTVTLDGAVPDDVLLAMLAHSYQRAMLGLTRARRRELQL